MISAQSFNAVFREFITVVKVATQAPDIKHDIKKNYRAWDSLSPKHAAQFHKEFEEAYPVVAVGGVAKLVEGVADRKLMLGRTVSEIFDSLPPAERVRAHACLAALFAISMATHVAPEDPPACAAAHKAVIAALASPDGDAALAAVILDDELAEFIRGAGALLRIKGACGLSAAPAAADGMMTLARSITDNADPAVFERLSAQMSSGKLDIGGIMAEASKLLGNVDLSKLDLSGLAGGSGEGGLDIAGLMSGLGIDMGAVLTALSSAGK